MFWVGLLSCGMLFLIAPEMGGYAPGLLGQQKDVSDFFQGRTLVFSKGEKVPFSGLLGEKKENYNPGGTCFSARERQKATYALFGSRPPGHAVEWQIALDKTFRLLGLDCADKDFFALVLAIILQESGAVVDPPLSNKNLSKMFSTHVAELAKKSAVAANVLGASGVEQSLKVKLRRDGKRGVVQTEGDLVRYVAEDLRPWFQNLLMTKFHLPRPLASLTVRYGLSNPVSTLGPMQVNLKKSFTNAQERGELLKSSGTMRKWLLNPDTALERGLREGIYQARKSYAYYQRVMKTQEAVWYAAVDYNAGEFSSRNAAFQGQIKSITRRKILTDGDLLRYTAGKPDAFLSGTEKAIIQALPQLPPSQIRQDLLLEKRAEFSETLTALHICRAYKKKLGNKAGKKADRKRGVNSKRKIKKIKCPMAQMLQGAKNKTAFLKSGKSYSPKRYARSVFRRYKKIRPLFAP